MRKCKENEKKMYVVKKERDLMKKKNREKEEIWKDEDSPNGDRYLYKIIRSSSKNSSEDEEDYRGRKISENRRRDKKGDNIKKDNNNKRSLSLRINNHQMDNEGGIKLATKVFKLLDEKEREKKKRKDSRNDKSEESSGNYSGREQPKSERKKDRRNRRSISYTNSSDSDLNSDSEKFFKNKRMDIDIDEEIKMKYKNKKIKIVYIDGEEKKSERRSKSKRERNKKERDSEDQEEEEEHEEDKEESSSDNTDYSYRNKKKDDEIGYADNKRKGKNIRNKSFNTVIDDKKNWINLKSPSEYDSRDEYEYGNNRQKKSIQKKLCEKERDKNSFYKNNYKKTVGSIVPNEYRIDKNSMQNELEEREDQFQVVHKKQKESILLNTQYMHLFKEIIVKMHLSLENIKQSIIEKNMFLQSLLESTLRNLFQIIQNSYDQIEHFYQSVCLELFNIMNDFVRVDEFTKASLFSMEAPMRQACLEHMKKEMYSSIYKRIFNEKSGSLNKGYQSFCNRNENVYSPDFKLIKDPSCMYSYSCHRNNTEEEIKQENSIMCNHSLSNESTSHDVLKLEGMNNDYVLKIQKMKTRSRSTMNNEENSEYLKNLLKIEKEKNVKLELQVDELNQKYSILRKMREEDLKKEEISPLESLKNNEETFYKKLYKSHSVMKQEEKLIEEEQEKLKEKKSEHEKRKKEIEKETEQIESSKKEMEIKLEQLQKMKQEIESEFEITDKRNIELKELTKEVERKNDMLQERKTEIENEKTNIEQMKIEIENNKRIIEEEKAEIEKEKGIIEEEKVEIEKEKKIIEEEKMKIEKEKKIIEEEKMKIEKENKIIEEEKLKIENENKIIEEEKMKIENEHKIIEEEKAEIKQTKEALRKEINEMNTKEENAYRNSNEDDFKESKIFNNQEYMKEDTHLLMQSEKKIGTIISKEESMDRSMNNSMNEEIQNSQMKQIKKGLTKTSDMNIISKTMKVLEQPNEETLEISMYQTENIKNSCDTSVNISRSSVERNNNNTNSRQSYLYESKQKENGECVTNQVSRDLELKMNNLQKKEGEINEMYELMNMKKEELQNYEEDLKNHEEELMNEKELFMEETRRFQEERELFQIEKDEFILLKEEVMEKIEYLKYEEEFLQKKAEELESVQQNLCVKKRESLKIVKENLDVSKLSSESLKNSQRNVFSKFEFKEKSGTYSTNIMLLNHSKEQNNINKEETYETEPKYCNETNEEGCMNNESSRMNMTDSKSKEKEDNNSCLKSMNEISQSYLTKSVNLNNIEEMTEALHNSLKEIEKYKSLLQSKDMEIDSLKTKIDEEFKQVTDSHECELNPSLKESKLNFTLDHYQMKMQMDQSAFSIKDMMNSCSNEKDFTASTKKWNPSKKEEIKESRRQNESNHQIDIEKKDSPSMKCSRDDIVEEQIRLKEEISNELLFIYKEVNKIKEEYHKQVLKKNEFFANLMAQSFKDIRNTCKEKESYYEKATQKYHYIINEKENHINLLKNELNEKKKKETSYKKMLLKMNHINDTYKLKMKRSLSTVELLKQDIKQMNRNVQSKGEMVIDQIRNK